MPTRRRGRPAAPPACCARVLGAAAAAIARAWRSLRRPRPRVEVLIADRARARALAGEVRAALRRLHRVLGPAMPDGIAVVVQQVVHAERPLTGRCEVAHRPDGRRFLLVRVALSVEARQLGTDEVLAALADQVVARAELGPRESVPLEIAPAPAPAGVLRPAALRGDPLVAHVDGRARRAA